MEIIGRFLAFSTQMTPVFRCNSGSIHRARELVQLNTSTSTSNVSNSFGRVCCVDFILFLGNWFPQRDQAPLQDGQRPILLVATNALLIVALIIQEAEVASNSIAFSSH